MDESWWQIIVRDGWVYFTDQGQSGLQEPSGYVYRYHRISKIVERVLSNIPSPNGLVLTTDATRLFVAVTRTNAIWRAPFVLDGGVSKVGVFLNLSGGGGPDGLAVDVEGGLIVAQPGFHLVLRLPTPEARIVGVHGIRENKHQSARNVGEIGTIVVGGGRIVEQALLRHEPTDCCR
ncbi:lactonase drp35 [Penicillium majusculum]|nr:lactonase drp35 [Penicillium majusculum]